MIKATGYVLEDQDEWKRLERQSSLPMYDYREELRGLTIPKGAQVLDAGCGSGVVTRYLASLEPSATVTGLDASEERMQMAQTLGVIHSNVEWKTGNLVETLPFESGSFDRVVCRYVLQHLQPRSILPRVISEFVRVLKTSGEVWLVDVDGLLKNIAPLSIEMERQLQILESKGPVDFSIGRKLATLVLQSGLHLTAHSCALPINGVEQKKSEAALMEERLQVAGPVLKTLLGEREAPQFVKSYLELLCSEECIYFPLRFVAVGKKSETRK